VLHFPLGSCQLGAPVGGRVCASCQPSAHTSTLHASLPRIQHWSVVIKNYNHPLDSSAFHSATLTLLMADFGDDNPFASPPAEEARAEKLAASPVEEVLAEELTGVNATPPQPADLYGFPIKLTDIQSAECKECDAASNLVVPVWMEIIGKDKLPSESKLKELVRKVRTQSHFEAVGHYDLFRTFDPTKLDPSIVLTCSTRRHSCCVHCITRP
jgi:hypothetical protein